jgi:RNA polymerase sigma factor (sigma-70 family)
MGTAKEILRQADQEVFSQLGKGIIPIPAIQATRGKLLVCMDENQEKNEKFEEWFAEITNPVTFTHFILTHTFGHKKEDEWVNLEDIVSLTEDWDFLVATKTMSPEEARTMHAQKALDRLVEMGKHPTYDLGFRMMKDENGNYKLCEYSKKNNLERLFDEEDEDGPSEEYLENLKKTEPEECADDEDDKSAEKKGGGLLNHTLLPHEETCQLIERFQNGDRRALERLTKHNTRFIASRVRAKTGLHQNQAEFWDYFQAGYMGFQIALERFELERGLRLLTYARWWVDQKIQREKDNHGKIVRIPVHMQERLRSVRQIQRKKKLETGEYLSPEMLAEELNWSLKKTKEVIEFMRQGTIREGDLKTADNEDDQRGMMFENLIAQHSVNTDDSTSEADQIINDVTIKKRLAMIRERLLSSRKLSESTRDRDIYVFIRRNTTSHPWMEGTLEDIGQECGITRERVRQLNLRVQEALSGFKDDKTPLGVYAVIKEDESPKRKSEKVSRMTPPNVERTIISSVIRGLIAKCIDELQAGLPKQDEKSGESVFPVFKASTSELRDMLQDGTLKTHEFSQALDRNIEELIIPARLLGEEAELAKIIDAVKNIRQKMTEILEIARKLLKPNSKPEDIREETILSLVTEAREKTYETLQAQRDLILFEKLGNSSMS